MPITNEVYYILYEGKDVKVSARDLMKGNWERNKIWMQEISKDSGCSKNTGG